MAFLDPGAFIGTNPENAANFCIARHPPRVAGKHSCNSLRGEAAKIEQVLGLPERRGNFLDALAERDRGRRRSGARTGGGVLSLGCALICGRFPAVDWVAR